MLLIIGLANLAGGAWILRGARQEVRVPGVVTGLKRSSDPDGKASFPVFRFTTREGEEVEMTSRQGESRPPRPGDRNARIETAGQDGSAMGRLVAGMGLFLIAVGVLTTLEII